MDLRGVDASTSRMAASASERGSGQAPGWPRGLILAAGLAYFGLAQAAFAMIGQPVVLGVSPEIAHGVLLAAAGAVFLVVAVHTARSSEVGWRRRTVMSSAAAAMLGALAHTFSLGVQVRWGERCNQCTPIAFMIELTLIAGIIAAIGAVPVGFIARRVGTHAR